LSRLVEMDQAALVRSAVEVDAAGAVELIRWTLQTDLPEELVREQCARADPGEAPFDSPASFRAWLGEYRRKAERRTACCSEVASPRRP
jgi:hypothetical protein